MIPFPTDELLFHFTALVTPEEPCLGLLRVPVQQAMPLLKGEEAFSVCGLPFTTVHWFLEKGIFAAPSPIVPFQQNHQILVLSVWHPFISTRKAHQCNSVYIALETLQDA